LVLSLIWTFGGGGFPFGVSDPDPGIAKGMSVLSRVHQDTAAPMTAACAAVAVVLGLLLASRRGGRAAEAGGWTLALLMGVVIPDYRPLVAIGHLPILLAGAPFGWPEEDTLHLLAAQVPWPVLNQFLLMGGAVLFALAARAHRRRRLCGCPACGRAVIPSGAGASPGGTVSPTRVVSGSTEEGRQVAARWGLWAVWVAAGVPLVYSAVRWTWALGIPLGFSRSQLAALDRELPGIWLAGAALGTMGLVGAVLTLGLIQRWGEVFPRWIPGLRGRRVPIPLAVVPALAVALPITSAGLMTGRLLITDFSAVNLAAEGPAVLWPLWGAALAVAAVAYYYRRRPGCPRCAPAPAPAPAPAANDDEGQQVLR
jgi:hypothetical protein